MKYTAKKYLALFLALFLLFTNSFGALAEGGDIVVEDLIAEATQEPVDPTEEPDVEPTDEPVVEPTEEPDVEPTEEPTEEPDVEPTEEPDVEPTEEPVVEPTEELVVEPTDEPDVEPTEEPVVEPTEEPVVEPTEEPVVEPTEEPVVETTVEPTVEPSVEPTLDPEVLALFGMMGVTSKAGGEHTVTINVYRNTGSWYGDNWQGVRGAKVTITDAAGNTWTVNTGYGGAASVQLPAGEYEVSASYSSGNSSYIGSEELIVENASTSVNVYLGQITYGSMEWCEQRYNSVNYFDHVDVRAAGSYSIGDKNYNLTISNVTLYVDGVAYPQRGQQSYEWRETGLRVGKDAVIRIKFDAVGVNTSDRNDRITRTNLEVTFSGKSDFIQAIYNCDAKQGLDFRVSASEIAQLMSYGVSYTWDIFGEDGVTPITVASFPAPPARSVHDENTTHTFSTLYTAGQLHEDVDGRLYKFSGWTKYWPQADSSDVTAITNQTGLTVDQNYVVYGYWVLQPDEPVDAHIEIHKTLAGEVPENAYGWFEVYVKTAEGEQRIDVDGIDFEVGKDNVVRIPAFHFNTTYRVVENYYEIPGYTTTPSVSGDGSGYTEGNTYTINVGDQPTQSDIQGLAIEPDSVLVGSVYFKNTYTRNVSDVVEDVWPTLTIYKGDALNDAKLQGAEFTLKAADGSTVVLRTNEQGYAYYSGFKAEGVYTLTESKAPAGYMAGGEVWTLNVNSVTDESGNPVYTEELRNNEFVKIYYHDIDIEIPSGSKSYFSAHVESDNTHRYALHVPNTKVTGKLNIVKSFGGDTDGAPESITVKVTGPDDYSESFVLNSGNDWSVSLDDLAMGVYTVTEEGSVANEGYTLDPDSVVSALVEFAPGSAAVIERTASLNNIYRKTFGSDRVTPVGLSLLKLRANTQTPLENAVFTVSGNGESWNVTSGADGVAVITGLVEGVYTITETTAPAGYEKSDVTYTVTVGKTFESEEAPSSANGNTFVKVYSSYIESVVDSNGSNIIWEPYITVYNTRNVGSLTINKVYSDMSVIKDMPVTVAVTGPNGFSDEVSLDSSNGYSYTFEDLALGEYTVVEDLSAQGGYRLTTSYSHEGGKVTLTSDNDVAAVTVTNTYHDLKDRPASFTIVKVDADDAAKKLAGAVFQLTDASGNPIATELVTNENGVLVVDDLVGEGVYTLKEVVAPAYYGVNGTEWTVTVSANGYENEIINGVSTDICIWNADVTLNGVSQLSGGVLTVENTRNAGDLTIKKEFGVDSALKDVEVTVTVTGPNGSADFNLNSGNEYKVELKNIPLGSYIVTEKNAAQTGHGLTTVYSPAGGIVTLTSAANVATVNITNTYHKDTIVPATFKIVKLDSDDAAIKLAGARFQLTDASGNPISTELVTNEDGEVIVGGLATTGTYTLKEIAAPEYYGLNDTEWTVTVSLKNGKPTTQVIGGVSTDIYEYVADVTLNGASQLVAGVLPVENTRNAGDLTIRKVFGENSALKDVEVTVTVTGPDGVSADYTLNSANGYSVKLEKVALGSYTVAEKNAAQTGYGLTTVYSPANGVVTLTSAVNVATVEITNTYHKDTVVPASFTIVKVDADDAAKKLAGARFELTDASGNPIASEIETNMNGEAVISLATPGTYALKEIAAPENYELGAAEWTVTVTLKNGKPTTQIIDGVSTDVYEYVVDVTLNGASQLNSGALTVPNEIKLGDLTVSKNVSFYLNGKPVAEAPDGRDESYAIKVYIGADDAEPDVITLKHGESHTFEDIPYGTYYHVEEIIPAGVAFNSTIPAANGNISAETTTVEVENAYNYKSGDLTADFVKQNALTAQPVAGAGFTLYADADCAEAVGAEVISDANGAFGLTLPGEGTYYVKETTVPAGYYPTGKVYAITAEYSFSQTTDANGNVIVMDLAVTASDLNRTESGTILVPNTPILPVDVSVRKLWNDDGFIADRPASIEVVLYRNGEAFETVTLSDENNWFYAWDNLTDEYDWTVDEPNVPAEYAKTVVNDGKLWTITNSRNTISISGVKVWDLGEHENVTLPESITIRLYADGVELVSTQTSAEYGWKFGFAQLPVSSDGRKIVYTISEDAVKNFKAVITGDAEHGFTVTNVYEPSTTVKTPEIPKTGDEGNRMVLPVLSGLALMWIGVALFIVKTRKQTNN